MACCQFQFVLLCLALFLQVAYCSDANDATTAVWIRRRRSLCSQTQTVNGDGVVAYNSQECSGGEDGGDNLIAAIVGSLAVIIAALITAGCYCCPKKGTNSSPQGGGGGGP